jgi:hypothetical protein
VAFGCRFVGGVVQLLDCFRHLEAIIFERAKLSSGHHEPARILRLSVTDEFTAEREAVVAVQKHDRDRLAAGILQVRETLTHLGLADNRDLALAVLGSVVQDYISDPLKKPSPHDMMAAKEPVHE